MTEMVEHQLPLFATLPVLTEDERDDAAFRAKDRAWASLVELYDQRKAEDGLNYQVLGNRIGKPRAQVQRWFCSPHNMNMSSVGLLVEGMDADLHITVTPRQKVREGANYAHPSVRASAMIVEEPMKLISVVYTTGWEMTWRPGVGADAIHHPREREKAQ